MANLLIENADGDELDDGLCPDCQETYLNEYQDDYDGHYYLLCPNIDCRAKIWISDIDDDDD